MGNTIQSVVEEIRSEEQKVTVAPSIITLQTWKQKTAQPPKPIDWVVKGIAARGEITLIAAPGGVGKSLWSLQMDWCMVRGIPFHDEFDTVAGNVLILDNENGGGVSDRRAFKLNKQNNAPAPTHEIYYHEVPQNYFTADDANVTAVQKLITEGDISLVVVDSLVSIFPEGVSENSSTEVRTVMNRLSRMIRQDENGKVREKPPAMTVIHHTSKGEKDDGWSIYRGSSDVLASVSTLIGMRANTWFTDEGEEKSWVQFRFEKNREGGNVKGIYQFAIEDQGHEDQNNPLHWFRYEVKSKLSSQCDKMRIKTVVTLDMAIHEGMEDGVMYTANELADEHGLKTSSGGFRRKIAELVKYGFIIKDSTGRLKKSDGSLEPIQEDTP